MILKSDPRVAQIGHPAPPWLINYADLMTELVCFFVILYALSAALDPQAKEVPGQVEAAVEGSGFEGKTEITQEGIRISLQEKGEKALFKSGRAELIPEARQVIARVAEILKGFQYEIVVEGHTDTVPIGASKSHFASNWELSTARATTVVRYLIDRLGLPPSRLAAIGYGQHRPIAPNDSEANRAKNRRVVFLLKTTLKKFGGKKEPAAAEATSGP